MRCENARSTPGKCRDSIEENTPPRLPVPVESEKQIFMRSFTFPAALAGLLAITGAAASGEEAATAQELRELRQAVQWQAKQIEMLTEQIGRLTRTLETTKAPDATVAAPAPAAEPVPEAPRAEPVIKAEAAPPGVKHVVAKGETLTSIAKQYNIPIADLKNTNKIENDRKLQIGQVLLVPAAKSPETSDKKENP